MLRMPLKLKWGKKSGRYDLSQDIYVLTIYIGEFAILQSTLTTESTAEQCMEYLSQKVDLNQVEMFGLRYQMKTNDPDKRMMRWVELDKPLRKQLEKWACKPRQVQLAVLYHTPNAFTLTDQMARSYYFLLMKLDVVEGKLTVPLEKYINLAAYSLQVEYGDFDPSIHTIDFMQTIPLLPKHICRSAQILEDLLKRVSAVYQTLRGMQPSYAALLYIVDAQQCEGYGEEYFNGKDEDSNEVKIGYSQEGIVIKGSYAAPLKHKWDDIKDIQWSKRHLNIRLMDGGLVQFTMEDAEMARYAAMVMMWQFRYATSQAIVEKNCEMNIHNLQGSIRTFNQMRSSTAELNSTRINGEYAALMMHESAYSSSVQHLSSPKYSVSNPSSQLLTKSMYNLSTNYTTNNGSLKHITHDANIREVHDLDNLPTVHETKMMKLLEETSLLGNLSKSGATLNVPKPTHYDVQYYSSAQPVINGTHMATELTPKRENFQGYEECAALSPVTERKKRLIGDSMSGSSPEIHMIGVGQGRSAAALVHKHSLLNTKNLYKDYHKQTPSHALSSPDLLSSCSSPDPITVLLDRYKVAVAELELKNAAAMASTYSSNHANIIPQLHRVYGTKRGVPNMNNHTVGYDLQVTTKYLEGVEVGSMRTAPYRDSYLTTGSSHSDIETRSLQKSSGSGSAVNMPGLKVRPVAPTKAPTESSSYLSQVGHIYYPQSSNFYFYDNSHVKDTEARRIEDDVFCCQDGLKPPPPFSAHMKFETIEEGRIPESFSPRNLKTIVSSTTQTVNDSPTVTRYNLPSEASAYSDNQITTTKGEEKLGTVLVDRSEHGDTNRNPRNILPKRGLQSAFCDKNSTPVLDNSEEYVTLSGTEKEDQKKFDASPEMVTAFQARHVLLNGLVQQHSKKNLLGAAASTPLSTNDDTLKALTAKLLADGALEEEFTLIPNKRMSAGVSTSQKPENMKRNRTRSIVPYEDTRVMLHSKPNNPTGYVNASNIQVPIGDHLLRYILTQAPFAETIEDFWQMIWESGAQLIVMLCGAHESKNSLVPYYWPQKIKSKLSLTDYVITLVSSTSSKQQTTSLLNLKKIANGERRTVYHLRLLEWNTNGVPSNEESFLAFMDAVNSVKRHLDNELMLESNNDVLSTGTVHGTVHKKDQQTNSTNLFASPNRERAQLFGTGTWRQKLRIGSYGLNSWTSLHSDPLTDILSSEKNLPTYESPPIVIHCLTGAHESGVYLLVEILIQCIEHNMSVDIEKALRMLRQQRMCLIKTIEQYRFVYQVLVKYLQKSRLI